MTPRFLGVAFFLLAFTGMHPDGARPAGEPVSSLVVSVCPLAARPGDTVQVQVPRPSDARAADCIVGDRTVPMVLSGGAFEALIGLGSKTKPGALPLTVLIQRPNGLSSVTRQLQVLPRAFRTQVLTVSKALNSLRFDPKREAERLMVRQAVNRETPERLWSGRFLVAVSGRITTGYGWRRTVNGDPNYGAHSGWDIAAKKGVAVRAANAGVVTLAQPLTLEGNTIVLDHGQGVCTLYLHLSQRSVGEGDAVEKGQVIGTVGSTGFATGAHLHWSLYVHDVAVDATPWLNGSIEAEPVPAVLIGPTWVDFPIVPRTSGCTLMVPVEPMARALGASAAAATPSQREVRHGRQLLVLTAGNLSAESERGAIQLSAKPFEDHGFLFVALRDLAGHFGHKVAWNEATGAAVVE